MNTAALYTDDWYKRDEVTWLSRSLARAVGAEGGPRMCVMVDSSGKVIACGGSEETASNNEAWDRSFAGAGWLEACVREGARGAVHAGFSRDGGAAGLRVGRGSIAWASPVRDADGNAIAACLAVWGLEEVDAQLAACRDAAVADGCASAQFGIAEDAGRGVEAMKVVSEPGTLAATERVGAGTELAVVAYVKPAAAAADGRMVWFGGLVLALVVGLVGGCVAAAAAESSISSRAKRLTRLVQAEGSASGGGIRMLDSTLDATEVVLRERRAIMENTQRKVRDGSQRAMLLTDAIADLADEANLVALNASIEIGRAHV